MAQHSAETVKHVTDGLSILTVVGTLAALFSLVWSLIRIWETQTVQDWIKRRK